MIFYYFYLSILSPFCLSMPLFWHTWLCALLSLSLSLWFFRWRREREKDADSSFSPSVTSHQSQAQGREQGSHREDRDSVPGIEQGGAGNRYRIEEGISSEETNKEKTRFEGREIGRENWELFSQYDQGLGGVSVTGGVGVEMLKGVKSEKRRRETMEKLKNGWKFKVFHRNLWDESMSQSTQFRLDSVVPQVTICTGNLSFSLCRISPSLEIDDWFMSCPLLCVSNICDSQHFHNPAISTFSWHICLLNSLLTATKKEEEGRKCKFKARDKMCNA